jgi:head-tail adaptor
MNPARLKDRLRFERRAAIEDAGDGVVEGTWEAQFTRSAEIVMAAGGEAVIAAGLQGRQAATVRVRFDSSTAAIAPDWRAVDVRDESMVYAIKAAVDMDRRRTWITLAVEAGVAP